MTAWLGKTSFFPAISTCAFFGTVPAFNHFVSDPLKTCSLGKKRLSMLVKRPNHLTLMVDFTTLNARSEIRPLTAYSPENGLLTYRRSIEKLAIFSTGKTRRKATLCPTFWARESLCFFQVCKYLRWTRDDYRALFLCLEKSR